MDPLEGSGNLKMGNNYPRWNWAGEKLGRILWYYEIMTANLYLSVNMSQALA
jgi:hypothetical protein